MKRRTLVLRGKYDHTVEARLAGKYLKPGEEYFYRFETTHARESQVGRFQTALPGNSREPVKIVFFSCQDWQAGYFGAHSAIAREDADLVVCLGDYIYERNFYDGPRKDTLGANRDGEVQTLAEYRSKYRMYKTDADLRAMHASAPVRRHLGRPRGGGQLRGQQCRARRPSRCAFPSPLASGNGYRAFYEYMPFRPLHRQARARARPLPADAAGQQRRAVPARRAPVPRRPAVRRRRSSCPARRPRPSRGATSGGGSWTGSSAGCARSGGNLEAVGNQLMIMSLDTAQGAPINKDSWDGYGQRAARAARARPRLRHPRTSSFLTGDIHTFFAGDVGVDGRGPESVATEFVGGSITSLGVPETLQSASGAPLSKEQFLLVSNNLPLANPHLKYQEQSSRGYGVLEASPARAEGDVQGGRLAAAQLGHAHDRAVPRGRRGEPAASRCLARR